MDAWLQNLPGCVPAWHDGSVSAASLVVNVGKTWERLRRVSPLTPIHGRGADRLSATLVRAHVGFVYLFIYWSVAAR